MQIKRLVVGATKASNYLRILLKQNVKTQMRQIKLK